MCPASQAHTLLLDIEQLTMKANKLNDCSYSCSSSPCSTSPTDTLLGLSSKKKTITNKLSSPMEILTSNGNGSSSKTNYYDKYLDRFANLIDNYKSTTTSSLEHVAIKPVFYGNSDGLNDLFNHGHEFSKIDDFEWEKRFLFKTPPHATNKSTTTNNYRTNPIDYDFLTFTDDYSKLKRFKILNFLHVTYL